LLFAKAKLTPSGEIKVTINDDKEINTNPGNSLLSTLSEQGIFLPSLAAVEVRAECCRCQVEEAEGPSYQRNKLLHPQRTTKQLAFRMPG
jgi:Na+-transporting NADH:ubiquinone oxidoreductase subunit F